jgi:Na+-transporting methylmalonyl-CoA/oxaloacetate decarboxylase gamma subunit
MGSIFQGDFAQSIGVTAAGMGLVFAALGGLMLIIAVMQIVFRERSVVISSGPPRMARPLPEVATETDDQQGEAIAAIAVALAILRQREEALPPPKTTVVTFAPGTGAWQALGRLS